MIVLEPKHIYTESEIREALNLTEDQYADFASRFIGDDYLTYTDASGQSHFYFTSEAIGKALFRANRNRGN